MSSGPTRMSGKVGKSSVVDSPVADSKRHTFEMRGELRYLRVCVCVCVCVCVYSCAFIWICI